MKIGIYTLQMLFTRLCAETHSTFMQREEKSSAFLFAAFWSIDNLGSLFSVSLCVWAHRTLLCTYCQPCMMQPKFARSMQIYCNRCSNAFYQTSTQPQQRTSQRATTKTAHTKVGTKNERKITFNILLKWLGLGSDLCVPYKI